MPLVKELPIGNNVSLIRGLDDRTSDMEAKRNEFGAAVATAPVVISSATMSWPPSWPQIQKATPSGCAIIHLGFQNLSGASVEAGYAIDGTITTIGSSTGFYPFSVVFVQGLASGWHLFQLAVGVNSGSATVQDPFLIVWPF